ncbi:MAG: hypothetical protein QOH06_3396 [Acidobacteriota bacterium]|jgi:uncharacterized GH25 family protein|nr:hypothetical protein [Acidobacteriota bacterium]
MANRSRSALTLLGLMLAGPALAHDFWIEPSSFRPAPGERVAVRLRVGENLKGDPVPRELGRIERFAAVGPAGEAEVKGVEGVDPAGWVSPAGPGLHWLVFDSNHASVEQTGPKFDNYLGQEGLERIRKLRKGTGPVKEIYSRCAKSLIRVGNGSAGFDRVLGLELELVPEKNPYALKPGEALPLRLLYKGKPLDGALVIGLAPQGAKVSARTAGGRASLVLDRPGLWLIKAVHMVPAPKRSGAEWESLWASLTFELPVPGP